MAEYISRNEAIDAIKSLESSMPPKDNYAKGYDAALGRVLVAVRAVPPFADPQPVKHGHWIEETPKHSRCSCCDVTCLIAVYPISANANFCPNCGARMDGGAENDRRNL